jgi:hypothetical protein
MCLNVTAMAQRDDVMQFVRSAFGNWFYVMRFKLLRRATDDARAVPPLRLLRHRRACMPVASRHLRNCTPLQAAWASTTDLTERVAVETASHVYLG